MIQHRVSSRYAKSLIDLATASNVLDVVKADIDLIKSSLDTNNELMALFRSPIINSGKKLAIANQVYKGKINEATYNFLLLMIHKKREPLLDDICNSFLDLYYIINNIIKVKITTAIPLDEKSKSEISSYIQTQTGKKILLASETDATIIGGLVIRFEDGLYDASIQNQLNKIKNTLNKAYIS